MSIRQKQDLKSTRRGIIESRVAKVYAAESGYTNMEPLKKHRTTLYGRILASLLMFVAFLVLSLVGGVTGTLTASWDIPIIVLLVLSVVALPRQTRPRDDEARSEASADELEHFGRVRTWLMWLRILYLGLAAVALWVVPEWIAG